MVVPWWDVHVTIMWSNPSRQAVSSLGQGVLHPGGPRYRVVAEPGQPQSSGEGESRVARPAGLVPRHHRHQEDLALAEEPLPALHPALPLAAGAAALPDAAPARRRRRRCVCVLPPTPPPPRVPTVLTALVNCR